MKRTLRLGIPVAAVAAAAIAAGVLLATRPWDGEQAGGQTTEARACNLVYPIPPEDSEFQIRPLASDMFYGGRPILVVDMKRGRTSTNPLTGEAKTETPGLVLDAETGDVLDEQFFTPADEAAFKELLGTIRVDLFLPANAPWPYSEATARPARTDKFPSSGGAEIRLPDPGSGLLLSYESGDGGSGLINVVSCKSTMQIDLESGAILKQSTHPDDASAFERFRAAVEAGAR